MATILDFVKNTLRALPFLDESLMNWDMLWASPGPSKYVAFSLYDKSGMFKMVANNRPQNSREYFNFNLLSGIFHMVMLNNFRWSESGSHKSAAILDFTEKCYFWLF